MTIGIVVFALLCLIVLFVADGGNKNISLPVTAGEIDTCPRKLIYHKDELLTEVDKKVISSYQKNIHIGRVYGNSVSKFNGSICNNDLFFADSDVPLSNLEESDIILIKKKKANGDICYKLRSFISYDPKKNIICTETSKKGTVVLSKPHLLGKTIDADGDMHDYIGRVVANISGYYDNKKVA